MAEHNSQVARELKWLDIMEPDPALLNLRELRGRSVNEELHMPSIRQQPSASGCSLLPQPSSNLDTDQCDSIDKTVKQVAQSVYQMLLKTSTGKTTSNLTLNKSPHYRIPNSQSILDPNPSDVHTQTKTQPTHTYRPASPKNSITHPVTNFEQTKQILMNIDALSYSPTLHNKNFTGIKPQWVVQI